MIIKNDLYDIADRLKEIDESYFIKYDKKLKRFEVHSKNQKNNTLCFVVPFEKLDYRTLEMAQKTRIENFDKLIKEMDKINEKLEL